MARDVVVITRERDRQREAVRTGLGLLLERHNVTLFVLGHEIDGGEGCLDNLGFLDEMGGERYSDHPVNTERHGFRPVTAREAGRMLAERDLVIPF